MIVLEHLIEKSFLQIVSESFPSVARDIEEAATTQMFCFEFSKWEPKFQICQIL